MSQASKIGVPIVLAALWAVAGIIAHLPALGIGTAIFFLMAFCILERRAQTRRFKEVDIE